jgi:voltage-gated potassium channel
VSYRSARSRAHDLLAAGAPGSLSRVVDFSIMALIAANVVAVALATVDPLFEAYRPAFQWFELVSVAVFSAEYVGRLWSCVEKEGYDHPVSGRVRYALRPLLVVDLLAIVPFFLATFGIDLRVLRSLRLFRFFRLFKLARYSESIRTFGRVAREKRSDLVLSLFATGVLVLIASSMMYFVESDAQPDAFSSIPAALWWGVVTLTTVGYGDVTPVTPVGKLLGGVIALLGVGLVALPASILASGFIEEAGERDYCPHCGEPLDEFE